MSKFTVYTREIAYHKVYLDGDPQTIEEVQELFAQGEVMDYKCVDTDNEELIVIEDSKGNVVWGSWE